MKTQTWIWKKRTVSLIKVLLYVTPGHTTFLYESPLAFTQVLGINHYPTELAFMEVTCPESHTMKKVARGFRMRLIWIVPACLFHVASLMASYKAECMASVQKKYKQHAASKKISVLPIPFHLCLHHSNHSHNFSLAEGNSEDITKIYDSPASPFGGSNVILHTAASIIFLTDIVTSWLKTCSGFLLRIAFTVCSNTLRPGQVGASTLWGVFLKIS